MVAWIVLVASFGPKVSVPDGAIQTSTLGVPVAPVVAVPPVTLHGTSTVPPAPPVRVTVMVTVTFPVVPSVPV